MHTFSIAIVFSCVTFLASARPMNLHPRAPVSVSGPPSASTPQPGGSPQLVVNGAPGPAVNGAPAAKPACTDPNSCPPSDAEFAALKGLGRHIDVIDEGLPGWQQQWRQRARIHVENEQHDFYLNYTHPIFLSDAVLYTVVDEDGEPVNPRTRAKIPIVKGKTPVTPNYKPFETEIQITKKVTESPAASKYVVKYVAGGYIRSQNADANEFEGRPVLITLDVPRATMADGLARRWGSRDACYAKSVDVARALITAYDEVSKVTPVHQNLVQKSLFSRSKGKGRLLKAHLFDWEPVKQNGQQGTEQSTSPPSVADLMISFQATCNKAFQLAPPAIPVAAASQRAVTADPTAQQLVTPKVVTPQPPIAPKVAAVIPLSDAPQQMGASPNRQ